MIVEADPDRAVIWTKPDDWEYDAKQPLAGLGQRASGAVSTSALPTARCDSISKCHQPGTVSRLAEDRRGEVTGRPRKRWAMTKLIVGCGYLGGRVARLWRAEGHAVVAVSASRRTKLLTPDRSPTRGEPGANVACARYRSSPT